MTDPERFTSSGMLTLAGRAIAKVDRAGPRGASYVTYAEIEALVGTLAALGMAPVPPGRVIEDPVFVAQSFRPENVLRLMKSLETPVEQEVRND